MAKKFGRRRKPGAGEPGEDPRDLFGSPQLPRHAGRPASSTPLADYLARDLPGVDSRYVVLPRSLAETMSLPWQQQMAGLLAQFHEVNGRLDWPVYRVMPSRYENLVDLDEEQLAEAGFLVEMDAEGEMVYRERSGRKVEDPQHTTVLVSSLDPIPRPEGGGQRRPPADQPTSSPPERGRARPPAPMNIGPQPVWTTTPTTPRRPPAEPPQRPPAEPPEPARPAPPPPAPPAPPDTARAWSVPPEPKWDKSAQPSEKPAEPKPRTPAREAPKPPVQPEKPEPRTEETPKPRSTIQQHLEQPAERHPQPPRETPKPEPPKPEPPKPGGWAAQPPQRPADADSDTPPPGFPRPPARQPKERGWFDDYTDDADSTEDVAGESPANTGDSGAGGEFGPTGEPTEIPYRYWR